MDMLGAMGRSAMRSGSMAARAATQAGAAAGTLRVAWRHAAAVVHRN